MELSVRKKKARVNRTVLHARTVTIVMEQATLNQPNAPKEHILWVLFKKTLLILQPTFLFLLYVNMPLVYLKNPIHLHSKQRQYYVWLLFCQHQKASMFWILFLFFVNYVCLSLHFTCEWNTFQCWTYSGQINSFNLSLNEIVLNWIELELEMKLYWIWIVPGLGSHWLYHLWSGLLLRCTSHHSRQHVRLQDLPCWGHLWLRTHHCSRSL